MVLKNLTISAVGGVPSLFTGAESVELLARGGRNVNLGGRSGGCLGCVDGLEGVGR